MNAMSFRPFAKIVFWTAIVAYCFFGAAGVVFGPLELASFVPHEATAFGQIRFLKACELGIGMAFLMLRHRIHDDPFAQRFVAFILWVTPIARVVSMAADGAPIFAFQALAGFELLGALVWSAYLLETRRAVTAS